MLYQMLTGEVPQGEFLPASRMKPNIDPRFDAVILKAMSWDVDARYNATSALKADLKAALTPPEKVTDEKPAKKKLPPFQSAPSKKRGVPGMVAVVPVIVAVGLVALAVSVIQKKRGDADGPEPKRDAPPVFGAAPVQPLPAIPPKARDTDEKTPAKSPAQAVAKAEPNPGPSTPKGEPKTADKPKPDMAAGKSATAKAKSGEKPPEEFWKPPQAKPTDPVAMPKKPVSPASPAKQPPILMSDVSDLVKQRLAELKKGFEAKREDLLNQEYYPKMETLKEQYASALKRTRDSAKPAGNTALVQAIQTELQLLADNRAIPERDDASTPPELVELRTTYRTHRDANRDSLPSLLLPVYDAHLQQLDQLQNELLQVNRATDARFVELTVEDVRSARASLE